MASASEHEPASHHNVTAATPVVLPSDTSGWIATLDRLGIRAAARQLADNCIVLGEREGAFVLGLRREHELLLSDMLRRQIEQALSTAAGRSLRLRIELIDGAAPAVAAGTGAETPAQRAEKLRQHRQDEAEREFAEDTGVRAALAAFDAQIVPGSVRPR